MRLFTALDISPEARAALTALLARLKPVAPLQWSRPENLHITTKFIGEWSAADLPKLTAALRLAPRPGPIGVGVRGLGWFPNPHAPRVFFAAVHSDAGLPELAKATDALCTGLGIPAETKPFSPHLTLARVKAHEGLPALRQAIAGLDSVEFGQFTVRAFHLYESVAGPGGSTYKKIEEFPLL